MIYLKFILKGGSWFICQFEDEVGKQLIINWREDRFKGGYLCNVKPEEDPWAVKADEIQAIHQVVPPQQTQQPGYGFQAPIMNSGHFGQPVYSRPANTPGSFQ